jgi:dienelactone hydrolase
MTPPNPRLSRRSFTAGLAGVPLALSASSGPASPEQKTTPAQKQRREQLYALLGDLPPRRRPITAKVISTEERPGYVLEKLELDLNGLQTVSAYFAKPSLGRGPFATVLYNHAHGGDYKLGKDEFLRSRKEMSTPGYADFLTSQGMAGLCIDHWVFGERATLDELSTFKEMLWNGRVLWGMMVYDSLRAVDYLTTRPDVDARRLATIGLSMGSVMAQWVAALDERIKVCVDMCCLSDYQSLMATHGVSMHGVYFYVPSLLKHFTLGQINALTAPRAHLAFAGKLDRMTPADGLARIDAELTRVYKAAGVPERWVLQHTEVGHQEIPEMRAQVQEFLKKFLSGREHS